MKKHKSVLYIGNNLVQKTGYTISMNILSDLFVNEGIDVIKTSHRKNKVLRIFDMCFNLIKYRKKVDYVLIDVFSTSAFYYAYITSQLARILNLKYIPILRGGNLPFRLDRSRKKCQAIFNHSFQNVSPSNYLMNEFKTRGFTTILIPNTIKVENYIFKERKKLHPRLLFVRAFANIYNPTLAIKMLEHLKKEYPSAKLCMVGPDKDGTLHEVKDIVKALKLEADVEFTGVLSQKEWHKKAEDFDIFINTSNIDNTPVSVIEAMALGLPVVSTNVGGISYLIEDKVNGLLVAKNDVKAMTLAIQSLLEGNHKVIPKKARKKVEQFSWNVVKNQWINLLYS
ncbi:MAG: glycosyltransferase family 4 protein [Flavobacteriaceae bacterium]|nr:glycosyltransferase family 4 protein [Flavobacteriaceae bacterium]